jgi:hypothetical protein
MAAALRQRVPPPRGPGSATENKMLLLREVDLFSADYSALLVRRSDVVPRLGGRSRSPSAAVQAPAVINAARAAACDSPLRKESTATLRLVLKADERARARW